ncbi:MAG: hypothetical protein JW751_13515 [Polyangiaceae bacterium]|nr:hypothetical protein [Polyangiaceae bacterium]
MAEVVGLATLALTANVQEPPRPTLVADRTILWAGNRPEHLGFLRDYPTVEVAFFALTLELDGEGVRPVSREPPLWVPSETALTAVVRLEPRHTPPSLAPPQRRAVVAPIVALASHPSIRGVQVDFAAAPAQRGPYRQLLAELHAALPESTELSVVAPASWCTKDPWLDGGTPPIDAVVPRSFAMGEEGRSVHQQLIADGGFRAPLCQGDVGVATDEPWPLLGRLARVWVQHPRSWTASSFVAEVRDR